MIKFEEKYVHCFWKDELKGKKGFVADTIQNLRMYVEDKAIPYIVSLKASDDENYQFTTFDNDEDYQFCYYDPHYELKVAYEEGKAIQYKNSLNLWVDISEPYWNDKTEYRIKPKQEEFEVVILYEVGLRIIPSTSSGEFRRIFFKGLEEECKQWIKDNYNLKIVIDGYFENEPIVYKEKGVKNDPWKETKELPYNWDIDHYEYRIATHKEFLKKVHSKKYVPFENTQEFIEAWEKKYPSNKNRPKGTMPLIWIMPKDNQNNVSLITDFGEKEIGTSLNIITFESLFKKWLFADCTPCGKEE